MRKFSSLCEVLLLISFLSACGAAETEETEETTSYGTTESGEEANLTTTASSNISTVSENLVPGSLAVTSLRLQEDNPCEGTSGLFDCQPNLVKLYMNIAKQMVSVVQEFVSGSGEILGFLGTGVSGTFAIDEEGEDLTSIIYRITTVTDYELIGHTADGPAFYIKVDGTQYTLKADIGLLDDDGDTTKIQAVVDYSSETEFTINFIMGGGSCESEDVRAPQDLSVMVTKTGGAWQGKAMMHSPRWAYAGDPTCDLEPTDTTRVGFYTDFVGDDTNTSAAFYMLSNSVTSVEQFASYEGADFCTNWSLCNNGYGFGDQNPVSSYTNNFCITGTDTDWTGACSSDNTLISTPTFGDSSLWLLPAEFFDISLTVPSSLE